MHQLRKRLYHNRSHFLTLWGLNSPEDCQDNWRHPQKSFSPPPWMAPTPDCHDSWTLTFDSQTARWFYSFSCKNTAELSVLNLWEQNPVLHESTRLGGRQNIPVTEHRGGVSVRGPTAATAPHWRWDASQSKNGRVSNNPGDGRSGVPRSSKGTP